MTCKTVRLFAAALTLPAFLGAGAVAAPAVGGAQSIAIAAPSLCKSAAERGFGTSPAAAVQSWRSVVIAKFGASWSSWPLAKAKSLTNPVGSRWIAEGKPCPLIFVAPH